MPLDWTESLYIEAAGELELDDATVQLLDGAWGLFCDLISEGQWGVDRRPAPER